MTKIWSVLVSIPCAFEKNVYSGCLVSCSVRTCVTRLIHLLLFLPSSISYWKWGVQLSTIIVDLSFFCFCFIYFEAIIRHMHLSNFCDSGIDPLYCFQVSSALVMLLVLDSVLSHVHIIALTSLFSWCIFFLPLLLWAFVIVFKVTTQTAYIILAFSSTLTLPFHWIGLFGVAFFFKDAIQWLLV